MITNKDIIKIFFILLTLIGATAGVVLTQQSQDIREKATNTCASSGGSCIEGGCPQGYSDLGRINCPPDFKCCKPPSSTCVTEGNICNQGIASKECCEPLICKYTEDSGPDPICVKPTSPTSPPGGGGGGGSSSGQCSSASATQCQEKKPGDNCGSGKKCKDTGQKGSDGKPKCSCSTSGGGSGSSNSCNKNPNPAIIDITSSGELVISFANFVSSTPPKIALKKNSQTCSLTEYDRLIDTKDSTPTQMIKTGIQVKNGDRLCIYGEDIGSNAGPYPFEGWTKPENNKCKDKDISPMIQAVQNSGATIISQQCWGDYAKKPDCDFNDYALLVSSIPTSPRPDLCINASTDKNELQPGETVVINSRSKEPVEHFIYAVYNMDNLYGPDNAKPVCVKDGGDITTAQDICPAGSHLLIFEDPNKELRKSGSRTLRYEELFVKDELTGKTVSNLSITAYFQKEGEPISVPKPECVVRPIMSIPTERIKILFRQQGITSQVSSDIPLQTKTFIRLQGKSGSYQIEGKTPSVNESGIWSISFSTDDQGNPIPPGIYDIYVKGISHLKKKFKGVEIGSGNITIDKSTSPTDELKAGDVNNDNIISIEDISQVLKFYTDFKVKVNPLNKNMVGADINKDGYITIDDLALAALNWSDFVVKGD